MQDVNLDVERVLKDSKNFDVCVVIGSIVEEKRKRQRAINCVKSV